MSKPYATHWPPYRPVKIPKAELLSLGLLLVLGYWQVAAGYFQAEDFPLVQNLYDGEGELRWSIVPQHFVSQQHLGNFRPLVTLIHILTASVFGPDPFAFRALNLLAHFGNGILLYVLVAKLTPSRSHFLPFLSAALFVTHPIHPEAVSYISAVSGPACLLLYLSSLVFFVNYAQTRTPMSLIASLVFFASALAMKEEALSLPFVVGLLTVWHFRWFNRIRQVLDAAGMVLPYGIILALYFGYRYLIFGTLTPAFYAQIEHGLPEFLDGLPVYAKYVFSPVNQVVIGADGAGVAFAVLVVVLVAFAVSMARNRPSPWGLLFSFLLFTVLLVPYFKVVPFGIYENLLQSRYLYMPSVAAVFMISWAIFGRQRPGLEPGVGDDSVNRFSLIVGAGMVVLQLVVLNSNNFAWAEATRLSRQMREQAMALSGNDPNIEVVNLPDNVFGALFDRGGFHRSYFFPFTPDNFVHRQTRNLKITNTGKSAIRLRAQLPEPSMRSESAPGMELKPGASTQISVNFEPDAAKAYSGRITLEAVECDEVFAEIPVRGKGVVGGALQTHIAAAIGRRIKTGPNTQMYRVSISDLADGVDAVLVAVDLPPGVPARLDFWRLNEDQQWVGLNEPITIADGESEQLKIEIRAGRDQRAFLVAPKIRGANTPQGANLRMVPVGDAIFGMAREKFEGATYGPVRRHPEGAVLAGECASAGVSSQQIDFGYLPIVPRGPRAHEAVHFLGQSPVQLLWDSQHQVLVPGNAWGEVDVIVDLLQLIDDSWIDQFDAEVLQDQPRVIQTIAGETEKELFFRGLRVPAASVSYLLFDLKFSYSPNPYVHLAWRGSRDKLFSDQRRFSVVSIPDGISRTYAIPLHELASWRSSGWIESLRFSVGASGAKAEISRLQLVGPVRHPKNDSG